MNTALKTPGPDGGQPRRTWQAASVGAASGRARRGLVRAAVLLALGGPGAASAALTPDHVLDQVSTEATTIVVQFSCPMSYVSNYPLRSGDELRIELQPLPGCAPPSQFGETLPVAKDNPAGLVDLRLDPSLGSRRALTLHFSRIVDFLIRPRTGLTGIEIQLARRVGRGNAELVEAPAKPSRAPVRAMPSAAELEQLTKQAHDALESRNYDDAIRLYTRLLEYPEHPGRAQAQNFLGLARERKGQLAQAKAEYQEYLRRYPDGADVDAVSQRLAAIVTLEGATKPTGGAPDGSRWKTSGAVSQEYRRDQNNITSNGLTANGIGQSALTNDADLTVSHRGDVYDFRARVFAAYLRELQNTAGSAPSQVLLPQAYAEVDNTRDHWSARLGRQSQSTGGIYGTYDGAYVGWRVLPGFRLNVAGGAPLETYSAHFQHQRVFGAVSGDFIGVRPGLDLSAFAFEQKASGVLDERQVGGEARYYRNGQSLVGQFDYDVSYHVLNAVTVLASWSLPDRWVATTIIDHRKSPFVGTNNALIGQPTTSLDSLIQTLGLNTVRQLAVDRSAIDDTVTLGVQRPIGERLQWGSDISYSKIGGTPASGGVAATPAIGRSVSFSTQILGGGWLVEGDMNTVGIGYATGASAKVESMYASARYPFGRNLRIGPRLQVSHTSGGNAATGINAGWSAGPSLLADWRFRHGLLQFESGYERSALDAGAAAPGVPITDPNLPTLNSSQQTRRFWFSLGYSFSF